MASPPLQPWSAANDTRRSIRSRTWRCPALLPRSRRVKLPCGLDDDIGRDRADACIDSGRCRDASTAEARDEAGRRTCLDPSRDCKRVRSTCSRAHRRCLCSSRPALNRRSNKVRPVLALELIRSAAMMAMPMPTGAVPGAAPMQPTIVIMAAPAPSPTDTHESPSQHREISGSPSSHHDSPHASDHAGSDASPPRSHSHEHLTEAIEEVLETVLTRHKSHDGDKHGHHDKQHAHPKTGLAVAAGSAVLKQTLQRSAKVRKSGSEPLELTERRSTAKRIVAKTRPDQSHGRCAIIERSSRRVPES